MRVFDAEYLESACDGKWANGQPADPVTGFCYDTRSLRTGDLFVAIKTTSRDGHDFLNDALEKGAVGALCEGFRASSPLPQLIVEDSIAAFGSIAARYRREWDFPVIAITGSCGKTTVKDLLSLLLGGPPIARATSGNLNNLIGVPATLLSLDEDGCRYAIVEAGISEPGEMAKLAEVIQPDTVVYTAIGPAHLECLRDVDTIAFEKGKLSDAGLAQRAYLGPTWKPFCEQVFGGVGFLIEEGEPANSRWSFKRSIENKRTRIDIKGPEGLESYWIEFVGQGSASNAALAISVARDCGVSAELVALRLKDWKPSGMRGEWRSCGENRVYLDCYNANPLSMKEALDVFRLTSEPERRRLYIIGCMEELGNGSADLHEQLGADIPVEAGDYVRLLGDDAESVLKGMRIAGKYLGETEIIPTVEALQPLLNEFAGDVFLKGSRRYRLESSLDFIKQESCEQGVSC